MTRVSMVAALALALLAVPLAAGAQQAGKVYRIGILSMLGEPTWPAPGWKEFRQALRELGYVEGQNLVVEYRSAEGKAERLPALATELVTLNPDVMIAGTTVGALAARNATMRTPIVFTFVSDPVGTGLVTSLARPGGNITGIAHLTQDLIGKRLQMLKELIPNAASIAVLANPSDPGTAAHLAEAERAARLLAMKLQIVEARTPDEIDRAFSAAVSQRPAALLVDPNAMFFVQRSKIVGLAARHRLPAIYESRGFVDVGGLMFLGAPYLGDLLPRMVALVDKILKGAKPADLPVEQPTKFDLVINLKTAKALGLTIPPAVLARADEVIQ
jgi:ABC-type uncharacterized transport system substrate-binding protein